MSTEEHEGPSDIVLASELGQVGLKQWGLLVAEEFLPQLQHPQATKIYQEMSDNDPTIGAVLYMMKQLIRKAGWEVKAASDKSSDKAAAEFLHECMHDMSGVSWDNTISEVLSMFTYGYSFHEMVFKRREGYKRDKRLSSKYSDGRIGWLGFPIRSQATLYGWEFDDRGEAIAFKQQPPPHYRMIEIPLDRGLLFRTEITRGNPEGRSLLRNAYRPWYFKKRIEEVEGIGIERDLAGLPMMQPPDNVDIWDRNNPEAMRLKSMAENLVRNVRRDKSEGVLLPFGWEFKLLSTGGTRQFDTNAIINRYDNRIAVTMLADIVMMGGDKVGSFALGEVKKSLLAASLEAHIRNIADVFNTEAVPKLFRYNYFRGVKELPMIVPGEVETPDIKELAFLMRAGGLNIRKDLPLMNMLRRLISLDPLKQEELDTWYADVSSETGDFALSGDRDPLGHMMDDSNQNYEAK